MSFYQGQSREVVLFLSLAGAPSSGITPAQVIVETRKADTVGFVPKVLTSSNWLEIGSGFYALTFSSSDFNTLGPYLFTAQSTRFDNFKYETFDIDPVPISMGVAPSTCIVSGNIVDIGGQPGRNQNIIVRPVNFPQTTGGTSLVASDPIQTIPDAFGNFQVVLLQLQIVIFEIERTGVTNQVTVPAQSTANLLDLIPPYPPLGA